MQHCDIRSIAGDVFDHLLGAAKAKGFEVEDEQLTELGDCFLISVKLVPGPLMANEERVRHGGAP